MLTIPATALPGTYTYSYEIYDLDPDAPATSNFSVATVTFVVLADFDGDGVADINDLDDDNDGILDTVECNQIERVSQGGFNGLGNNVDISTVSGWTLSNGQVWSDNNTALQFSQDNATQTLSQTVNSIKWNNTSPVVNIAVLNRNNTNNTTTSGITLAINYDGVTYALLTTSNANAQGTISASNGASVNTTVLNSYNLNTTMTAYTNLSVTLPATVPANGTLALVYTSTNTNDDDLFIDNISIQSCRDLDGDGTPDYLDLDSDGDTCPDAIEGGENVLATQLNSNGSISTTLAAPNNGVGSAAANLGVPNLVNSGGTADAGSATAGTVGQPIGQSQDASKNNCIDSDSDGIPDWQDLDDDNDGILDTVECSQVYVVRPVTSASTTANKPITVGTAPQIVDGEGAGGTGSGPFPHWYTNVGNLPIAFSMNMQAASTIDHIKLYGPWGNDEWIGNFTVELYNAGNTLLGTESLTAPNQYSGTPIFSFSQEYTNVTRVRFTILTSQGFSGVSPQRASLNEIVFLDLLPMTCDTDGDGIPNHLDLDSDGDGCFDAIEGGENVNASHLNTAGSIRTTAAGVANSNNIASVNTNGVPLLVNTGGAADTGSATAGTVGQPIGQSQDVFKNDCIDSDGDGIADWQDLDNDNDGILNKDECVGFIANNVTGAWKGRTASNITISATPTTTQPNSAVIAADPQINYSINQNGGDQRFANTLSAVSYVLTFSTPVPANEIGLMIDDVSPTVSPSVAYKIDVDFGSGFVNPSGVFVKTVAGRNAGVGYNATTGVPSFQDLPNTATGEDIYLRGAGNRLVKAVRLTGTPGSGDAISYSFFALAPCSADNDLIPNDLDVDSDNDGCPDAVEGSENVTANQVHSLSLPTTDTNYPFRGQIRVTYNGTTAGTPAGIISNSPLAIGVPQLVNDAGNNLNSVTNSGNLAGVADNTDTPPTADVGQGIGDSQNALVNGCFCYEDPTLVANTTYPVKHGITILNRAGKVSTGTLNTAADWPMNKNSAYTALESKTKGFVVTRLTNPETAIVTPVVGMMVFDTDENAGAGCLKIYTGPAASEGWKCFTTQGCP